MSHSRDPAADLKVVRALRKKTRRGRQYSSRLDPLRTYIEAQRQANASYREIAKSLQMFHHMKVDPSTIKRAVDRWQAEAKTP